MKYIGNYADWIKPEWVDHLLHSTGFPRPENKILENLPGVKQNILLKDYLGREPKSDAFFEDLGI